MNTMPRSSTAGIEKRPEHYILGAPGAGDRRVLVQVVRAEAPALVLEGIDRRRRQGGDADQVALVARVEQPDQLRPIRAHPGSRGSSGRGAPGRRWCYARGTR